MAIIGIDLGTTNSLACIYRDGRAELIPNELGEYKTSSAVSVLQDGTVLVGAAAKERLEPSLRASLYRQAETAKIALSRAPAAAISIQQGESQYSLLLTAPLLRQLCEPVFQRVRAVISRAMKDRERARAIDDVILVGGSAQLSVFGDFLEELFGRRPQVAAKPDEIVALGVGLCAGIKERAEDLQDLVMTDVCPFSLGVATYSYRGDKTPHMAVLIPRSSMLPASHRGTFYTMYDNQRALRFEIYQGEGYFASENLKLGEVEVQVPPGPSGEQSATVTFTYDIDGILHVSARSSGGDQRDRLILNPNLHLSEAEREKVMVRISEIQLAAQGSQKEQLLLERALRLYEQVMGQRRELVGSLITSWKTTMDRGGSIDRERAYGWIREQLDALEAEVAADPFDEMFWNGEQKEMEDTPDSGTGE